MAVGAGCRSRRIEEDLLSIHSTEKLVTSRTSHVAVLAFQGEFGPLVVVEQGRLPLGRVVAVRALGDLVCVKLGELASVDVFVALFALLGGLLEVHVNQFRLQVLRLVAVDAGNRSVCTRQWERSRAVIETVQFSP